MGRIIRKATSVLLVVLMLISAVPFTTFAATGYDRGYTGSMPGDGKIYAEGLDVSSWQGESLDFQNFKNAGYDYVILRCGTTKGKDTCFETYYNKAKAAGLGVGAYYYSYATTVAGGASDAANTLSWLSGKKFEYPIYFDFEDPTQTSLDKTLSGNICREYMDTLRDAGYLVGFYSMASLIDLEWITTSGIRSTYESWVARYLYSGLHDTWDPTYSVQYGMYQYTDSKYVNGKGPFDANVCYKDYPSIVKKYGFNGYEPENMHTINFISNGGSDVASVQVQDGGTLTAPANPTRYGFNFAGWYCNKELTDPYNFSTPVPYSFNLYAKWEEAYWGAKTNLMPVEGELALNDYQGTGQYIWPYYNSDGSVTMYNGVTNDENYSWPSAYMTYENSFDSANDAYIYVKYNSTAMFNAVIDYLDADGNIQSVSLSQMAGNGDTDFPAGYNEFFVNFGNYIAQQGHLTPSDGSSHSLNVKFIKCTYYVVGELDSYVRLYDMKLTPAFEISGKSYETFMNSDIKQIDGSGSYTYNNGTLSMTADSELGYSLTINSNQTFNPTELVYLLADIESDADFNISMNVTRADGDATLEFRNEFYPLFGFEKAPDALPAGAWTPVLDFLGYYNWNGGAVSESTVKSVTITLTEAGTLILKALQANLGSSITYVQDGQFSSGSLTIDREAPVVSNATVSDITAEGYTVSCKVSDNTAVTKVLFETWLSSDPENKKIYEGTVSNGVATCNIYIPDFGGAYGEYVTQIYAYDAEENVNTAVQVTADVKPLGDADQNGVISINDATCIQKYCASLEELSNEALSFADANCDGNVDIKDATRIQIILAEAI